MTLVRVPDWQARLHHYVVEVSARGFRPGRHDCMQFGAGAVLAQTGVDLTEGWGRYNTLAQGAALLRAQGFENHIDLVAYHLSEIPPLSARVGDLAVTNGAVDASLGVVQGHSIYVLGLSGLHLVPLITAKRAFRV